MTKGGKTTKKSTLKRTLTVLSSVAFCAGALSLCYGCGDTSSLGYTLPKDTEIEVNVAYTPNFKLTEGTQAKVVSLQTPTVSQTEVEGLSFTPDVTGAYQYVVLFQNGTTQKQETITFTAVDLTAPVLGEIADKTAELGMYPLSLDLEEIALSATDNCATTVTVYPKSVVYDGKETPMDKDEQMLFFNEVGEYTVKFIVEDYSGNQTEGSYKITAKDTAKPVFHAPNAFIVWAENGKVNVPQIEAVDYTLQSVSVAATDKNGAAVAISNNQMNATVGEYNLTYTATDKSGNTASVTVKMYVQEKGVVNTFSSATETSVWESGLARYDGGKLVLVSEDDETEIVYSDYFLVNGWSSYKKLSFALENRRLAPITVQAELLVSGKWIKTTPKTLAPAVLDEDLSGITASETEYAVYLNDYAVTGADGIRLRFVSEGGVDVAMDNVTLEQTDDRTLPSKDALTGFGAGMYTLNATNGVAILKGTALAKGNAVSMELYSTAQADVRIVLKFGDVSVSAIRTLSIGENKIVRLPVLEKGVEVDGLTGVEIYNEEDYPVTLYVSKVATANATEIPLDAYAVTQKTFGLAFGESVRIPNPFLVKDNYYSNLTVRLDDVDGEYLGLKNVGDVLETVGKDALAAGEYKLNYFFTDALGAQQQIVYTLLVENKVLSLEVDVPAIVYSEHKDGFTLPDPVISSNELSTDVLATAEIKKYYRVEGESAWNLAENGTFKPRSNKWYEFIYTVKVGGTESEITFSKYVHKNAFTLDFEKETDVTDTAVKAKENMTGRFYHDNGYYDYRAGGKSHFEMDEEWSASGKNSLSMITPTNGWMGMFIIPFESETPMNCVTFTFNSEKAYVGGIQVGVDWRASSRYPSRWIHIDTEFKAGAHEYTLFFNETIKASQICALTVRGLYLYNVAIDDVEFKYMNQLSMSDIECKDTYTMDAYEVAKPTLSSDYYSAAQLNAAEYTLSYRIGNGEETIVTPDADGKYSIVFPKAGEVTLVWSVTVGEYTIQKTYQFQVCAFDIQTEIPASGYIGETINISAPTSNEYTISDYTVEYKLDGEEEWIKATKADNGYTFKPEQTGTYLVRVVAYSKKDSQQITGEEVREVYVRDKNNLAVDFEVMQGEEYHVGISDRGYDGCHINLAGLFGLDDTYAHTGKNSMRIQCVNGWWIGYDFMSIKIPKGVYGAIEFWTYTTTPFTMDLAVGTAHLNAAGKEEGQDTVRRLTSVTTTWTKHTLPFGTACAAYDTITEITFSTRTNGRVFYVDDIRFIPAELSAQLPTTLTYGDTVELPTCKSGSETVTAKYRLAGTTDLIALANGKATFNKESNWEIVYTFEKFEIAYVVTVNAPAMPQLDEEIKAFNAVMDKELVLPVGEYQGVKATISYCVFKESEETRDWQDVSSDNKLTFKKNGTYLLRYDFDGFDLEYQIEVDIPEFTLSATPTQSLIYGEMLTLPTATYKEETATVSYREKDTETWIAIEEATVTLGKVTTYELRYAFENFEKVYEIAVTLPEITYSGEFPAKVKQEVEVTLPTATINGETASIEYRKMGSNVWTPLKDTKIAFGKIAVYEIRYVFAGFDVVKTITVEDPNVEVLFDFETPFDKTTISTFGLTNPYTMTDRLETGTNKKFEYCRILQSWKYQGTSALQLVYSQGWDGPLYVGGRVLPFETDTFSFVINHSNASLDVRLEVYYYNDAGTLQRGEATVVGGKTSYEAGTHEITIKAPAKIKNLIGFDFKTYTKYYYVDHICAIRNQEA